MNWTCIKCGIELIIGKNWYEADRHKKFYICKKCKLEEMREISRRTSQKRRAELRAEIVQLLGGKCANPYNLNHGDFLSDKRCLQIDHAIRGLHGHAYERKSKGSEMYMKEVLSLIKSGSKDYQLLCANCNWIKRFENNEIMPKTVIFRKT